MEMEMGNCMLLVTRARELVRETAAGETRCVLRIVARRPANDGDRGTCYSVTMCGERPGPRTCVLLPIR